MNYFVKLFNSKYWLMRHCDLRQYLMIDDNMNNIFVITAKTCAEQLTTFCSKVDLFELNHELS